jgi:uncharacterized SAM-binding protein YcdF (DUF218 family)
MNKLEILKLIALVDNDRLLKSDAIVCLEGDGYNRIELSTKLLKEKWAKKVLISGGYDNPPFSIPAKDLAKELIKKGVPSQNIILEEKSQNTYEQSKEVMKIVKERKWKRIILVASHFHQLRAYLTFLKAMKKLNLKIKISNAPARNLSWFEKTSLGLNRLQLLEEDLKKIQKYIKEGYLATIKEAIDYQKWKERQK